MQSTRFGETILFHVDGGVDVGDVDAKAAHLTVPIDSTVSADDIITNLLKSQVHDSDHQNKLAEFIEALFIMYRELHFVYCEINPLVFNNGKMYVLDMAAKLDEAAAFLSQKQWGNVDFPAPFGRAAFPAELKVKKMDSQT
eukprot:gene15779-18710_t